MLVIYPLYPHFSWLQSPIFPAFPRPAGWCRRRYAPPWSRGSPWPFPRRRWRRGPWPRRRWQRCCRGCWSCTWGGLKTSDFFWEHGNFWWFKHENIGDLRWFNEKIWWCKQEKQETWGFDTIDHWRSKHQVLRLKYWVWWVGGMHTGNVRKLVISDPIMMGTREPRDRWEKGDLFSRKRSMSSGSSISPSDQMWQRKISHLPSGKRLHNYGKSPFYSWVNPLFLWPWLPVRKL